MKVVAGSAVFGPVDRVLGFVEGQLEFVKTIVVVGTSKLHRDVPAVETDDIAEVVLVVVLSGTRVCEQYVAAITVSVDT
jgi:hypothetical protein